MNLAFLHARRHLVVRSIGVSGVAGHLKPAGPPLDGPPFPFQVSLPVPLGNGTLGRRVAPLSLSMHIHKPCQRSYGIQPEGNVLQL